MTADDRSGHERFLSVRLGPHHLSLGTQPTSALMLEFESDQWVLYFLGSEDNITGCYFPGSLDAALEYAKDQFGVRPEEWTEDFSN
jgi:hypothetical protein